MESIVYEELLRQKGSIITHVVGTSMLPLLYNRESIVIVEAVDKTPPRKGDVVLYKAGNNYILHRILQINEKEYLLRGDNTWMIEHVAESAILATMTGFYRHPESRFVSRDNVVYRLYRLTLPGIRWGRRISSRVKHLIRKIYQNAEKT